MKKGLMSLIVYADPLPNPMSNKIVKTVLDGCDGVGHLLALREYLYTLALPLALRYRSDPALPVFDDDRPPRVIGDSIVMPFIYMPDGDPTINPAYDRASLELWIAEQDEPVIAYTRQRRPTTTVLHAVQINPFKAVGLQPVAVKPPQLARR